MSKKKNGKLIHTSSAKVSEIDNDEMGFIRLSKALLKSYSWKYKSVLVTKLIEFLLIEHLEHHLLALQ